MRRPDPKRPRMSGVHARSPRAKKKDHRQLPDDDDDDERKRKGKKQGTSGGRRGLIDAARNRD